MITIDYQSKLPLYEQIAKKISDAHLKRRASTRFADAFRSLPSQWIFPSIRIRYKKAYSLLEQERYIYPVKGRGNFVSDTTLLVEQTKKTLLENDFSPYRKRKKNSE